MKPLGHLAASVTTSYQPRSSKFETHLVKIEIIDEAKGNKRKQKEPKEILLADIITENFHACY